MFPSGPVKLDAIDAGEFEAPSKITFGKFLDRYFNARKGRLQETTLALYQRTFNHHVRPKIGDVRLDKCWATSKIDPPATPKIDPPDPIANVRSIDRRRSVLSVRPKG